jgi:Spy/CpxP family protein refolding chaperone
MHPAMMSWWRGGGAGTGGCGPNPWAAFAAACSPRGGGPNWHGPRGGDGDDGGGGDGDGFGGGGFGVRRPLRFLAHKLELDERQVGELAKILDELKTERAQAEVDRRRTLSAFADAVGGETFNQTRATEGAGLRVSSAERLRDAVTKALAEIHALLDNDQRERLAYLIRTGTLVV